MILYEYPLHERVRTYLRLEHLFLRLDKLVARVDALDHHYALATIFEIMEITARPDLKSDLLKDLDKQRHALDAFRGNPSVSEAALNRVLTQLTMCFETLNAQIGKAGLSLTENDWLMAIRNRINIPGGTCEFDLPSYYAWQHKTGVTRQTSLQQWVDALSPIASSVQLLLKLLRDSGTPKKVVATAGQFQQNLQQGRAFLLLRLALEVSQELIPEIIGHRLLVSIRLMRMDIDNHLCPVPEDVSFEISLCA